jgi:hypothetical protein
MFLTPYITLIDQHKLHLLAQNAVVTHCDAQPLPHETIIQDCHGVFSQVVSSHKVTIAIALFMFNIHVGYAVILNLIYVINILYDQVVYLVVH